MSKSRDLNIDDNPFSLIQDTRRPHLEPETGWYLVGPSEAHEVDFENSWGNVGVVAGVTNAPASWYLSEDGEVRLRGKIDGGSAGTVAFTLPEEVRPEYAETFICAVDGGTFANVTVHASGEVEVETIG
jgi:hypothetical protein